MNNNEIIEIIEDKITDITLENRERCSDEYYMKNEAKIEVLEEILRIIIG